MGVVVDLVVNALVAGTDTLEILPPDGGCAGCKSECGKVLGRTVVVEGFDCGGIVAEGEKLVSWLVYVILQRGMCCVTPFVVIMRLLSMLVYNDILKGSTMPNCT